MNIMDFANDDNFGSAWLSNSAVSDPWYELTFARSVPFNTVVITEGRDRPSNYQLTYLKDGNWETISATPTTQGRIKIFRFESVVGQKIRLTITPGNKPAVLSEVGVYQERR